MRMNLREVSINSPLIETTEDEADDDVEDVSQNSLIRSFATLRAIFSPANLRKPAFSPGKIIIFFF